MGKRILFIICFIFSILAISSAQSIRDYAIVSVDYEFVEVDSTIHVTVAITNIGASTDINTSLELYLLDTATLLYEDTIPPIEPGGFIEAVIVIPVEQFQANRSVTLEVRAGLDAIELANTGIAENNIETMTITLPENSVVSSPVLFGRTDSGVVIAGVEYPLPVFAGGVLGSIVILMLFWMFSLFIRALFKRPPRFASWQPPYGVMPYDQNTIDGRRWGWQQVAQNGLLLAPPNNGNVHPVKLLMSSGGANLENWKVTGMRLSQYDVYGRIARTQVVAEKKWVNRMNKILKQRDIPDDTKLQKKIRPITAGMVKQFAKKVNKKTAFLPIAYDIRFEGKHGDVRIIFELYQFSQSAWYRIDQWDPMMQIVSRTMQENYTFTIHGKEAGETMREFRERLRDDLIWLLMEMIRVESVQEEITGQQPAVRQQYDIPDTLTGMNPVEPEGKTPAPQGNV